MTEKQARQAYVNVVIGWMGLDRDDCSHKIIIDTYNNFSPKPTSYKVTYKDEYCATGVSAAAIVAGYTDIIPLECSCGRMIELFKKMGRWVEDDAFVPQMGDIIFYDWQDTGRGNNTGWSDHVGIVEKVVGNVIHTVECNINGSQVDRTTVKLNGKTIRGFGIPDYSKKITSEPEPEEPVLTPDIEIGSIIKYTGDVHYKNSTTSTAIPCKGGLARVTATSKNKHVYHLIALPNNGSTVYGWVDAKFVEISKLDVGEVVKFTGKTHYKSSTSTKGIACRGGLAKVTAISKGRNKYHLISVENNCSVHGWVNESDIKRL